MKSVLFFAGFPNSHVIKLFKDYPSNYVLSHNFFINLLNLRCQIGSHIKRILTIRANWFGVCVLLRIDFDHPIYGHVVPSIWHNFTHFGCNRIEFLFQQKNRRAEPRCTD